MSVRPIEVVDLRENCMIQVRVDDLLTLMLGKPVCAQGTEGCDVEKEEPLGRDIMQPFVWDSPHSGPRYQIC